MHFPTHSFVMSYSSPIYIVSIEGNIGSGKSTLLSNMKEAFGNQDNILFVDEPVHEWASITDENGVTILEKFYENQSKYSFPFQMMAFISRLKLLKQAVETVKTRLSNEPHFIVTERSLFTDKMVFASMLFDDGKMEHIEHQIYLKWFDEFSREFSVNKVIYVKTCPSVCHARIEKRHRDGESNIQLAYLENCDTYHEAMLNRESSHCVCADQLVLDGNRDVFEDATLWPEWHAHIAQFLKPQEVGLRDTYTLYFDGCSKGNPGLAGAGSVIYDSHNVEQTCLSIFVGNKATNNVAEYSGLVNGLQAALHLGVEHLVVKGDSELIIHQMNGVYKCKSPDMVSLHKQAKDLAHQFKTIQFVHVPRAQNTRADELANLGVRDISQSLPPFEVQKIA